MAKVRDLRTDLRLQQAAGDSYRRHCGRQAVECAEGDLLGELLTACRLLVRVATLVPIFEIGSGAVALKKGIAAIAKTEGSE